MPDLEKETRPSKMDDADLVKQINDWYEEAKEALEDWREETEDSYNFSAGNQWTEEDIQKLENEDSGFYWRWPSTSRRLDWHEFRAACAGSQEVQCGKPWRSAGLPVLSFPENFHSLSIQPVAGD